ncbi:MAG: hypothetical protein U0Q12_03135 [Vicinamibacterales bacterium]
MDWSLEYFEQVRSQAGYRWVTAVPLGDGSGPGGALRCLVEVTNDLRRHRVRHVLRDVPTLFREFAAIPATEESFGQFANEYGLLGVDEFLEGQEPFARGEPFHRWVEEQRGLVPVVDVLVALERGDVEQLRRWFSIESTDGSPIGVKYQRIDVWGKQFDTVATAKGHRPSAWAYIMAAPDDKTSFMRMATCWLQNEINERLSRGHPLPYVGARVFFNPDDARYVLHVVPRNLIGAMWYQCARSLTENSVFRSCAHCGTWFELSPVARRRNTLYCSPRCRVAAFRARRAASTDAFTSPRKVGQKRGVSRG